MASGAEALTPPPPPVTSDGVQLQGSWVGPYTVHNLNSERCLDINGASTANGALAVQYRCVAGGVSQMWWSWFVEGDGFIAFQLHANAHSGKCIRPVSTARNVAVVQQPCVITPIQIWSNTDARTQYRNEASGYCFEVQGGSLADFARIVQWDCHGRAHQRWLWRRV
nr:RICIN domain-containing protein [Micromonospora sp. DSM 115978]